MWIVPAVAHVAPFLLVGVAQIVAFRFCAVKAGITVLYSVWHAPHTFSSNHEVLPLFRLHSILMPFNSPKRFIAHYVLYLASCKVLLKPNHMGTKHIRGDETLRCAVLDSVDFFFLATSPPFHSLASFAPSPPLWAGKDTARKL